MCWLMVVMNEKFRGVEPCRLLISLLKSVSRMRLINPSRKTVERGKTASENEERVKSLNLHSSRKPRVPWTRPLGHCSQGRALLSGSRDFLGRGRGDNTLVMKRLGESFRMWILLPSHLVLEKLSFIFWETPDKYQDFHLCISGG